jgi:hypothetical protein
MPSSRDSLVKFKVKGSFGMAITLLFYILKIEKLAFTKVRYLYKSVTILIGVDIAPTSQFPASGMIVGDQ